MDQKAPIVPNETFSDFVTDVINRCAENHSYTSPLELSVNSLKNIDSGLCLEFGVWKGDTINFISSRLPNWKVYGFDSFEGLPEKWVDGYEKGTFSLNGNLPTVNHNVSLIKGFFNETLPEWVKYNNGSQINLLHVDCDLYSSTQTVLNCVKNFISNQTIVVFDELINYGGYESHEILALYEFSKKMKYNINILFAGGHDNQKVAISFC